MDLDGEFATMLGSHYPLKVLYDAGKHAAVIFELFGAVFDFDSGLSADELVMRILDGVLEAAPTTDVVDQKVSVIRFTDDFSKPDLSR